VCIDFDGGEARTKLKGFRFHPIELSSVRCRNPNRCLQHGEFLEALQCEPDDIIVFTDADMVMQRPMDENEVRMVGSLEDGDVAVGYNKGYDESLADEARIIGLALGSEQMCHLTHYFDCPQ